MLDKLTQILWQHAIKAATLASICILGAAFIFQMQGYAPCELCWWQRYPYMGVLGLAFISFVLYLPRRAVLGAFALLFFATAAIAALHVGVEQHWWEGPITCTSPLDLSGDVSGALDAILAAPIIRCDEVAWSLFGISMAGYNFLLALALGIFSLRVSLQKGQ